MRITVKSYCVTFQKNLNNMEITLPEGANVRTLQETLLAIDGINASVFDVSVTVNGTACDQDRLLRDGDNVLLLRGLEGG